jgi:hypothetical protein
VNLRESRRVSKLGMVAHAYKPNYSGDRGRKIMFKVSPGKKLARPYLKK